MRSGKYKNQPDRRIFHEPPAMLRLAEWDAQAASAERRIKEFGAQEGEGNPVNCWINRRNSE
jgi:hypothetical protein